MPALKQLQSFKEQTTARIHCGLMNPLASSVMITPWNWPLNQIALKVAPCDRCW
jgi:acyl-CoA reductase-like NAD-dependent aldehyde dehydrogenase